MCSKDSMGGSGTQAANTSITPCRRDARKQALDCSAFFAQRADSRLPRGGLPSFARSCRLDSQRRIPLVRNDCGSVDHDRQGIGRPFYKREDFMNRPDALGRYDVHAIIVHLGQRKPGWFLSDQAMSRPSAHAVDRRFIQPLSVIAVG